MKRGIFCLILFITQIGLTAHPAHAATFTIPTAGKVSIVLHYSESVFSNTLAVFLPGKASIAISGCSLEPEPVIGLQATPILSEKKAKRGCRVDLDADKDTPGIQGFAANTSFEFEFCAQANTDLQCEYVWNSNPANNHPSDNFDHLRITPDEKLPDRKFTLAWEDLPGGGDKDFNDLVAVLHVDGDTDGDGLWDDWEQDGRGIDNNGDGIADLPLPGANPQHRDVFVELDYMACEGADPAPVASGDCAAGDTHSHRPQATAIQQVIDAFAAAPISNPDGTNGVTLHMDIGNPVAHQNVLGANCEAGNWGSFDSIKADPANFGAENLRRFAYHYALFAHRQQTSATTSGCAETPGNDLLVTLGGWDNDVGSVLQQAGTLMHELGHNLGLQHGGGDKDDHKPNYISVMNHFFQFGIPTTTSAIPRLDYSHEKLPDLDENGLDETVGIGPRHNDDLTAFFCPDKSVGTDFGLRGIDWSCNEPLSHFGNDTFVIADLNKDNNKSVLTGFKDWDKDALKFAFQTTSDFEDGVHSPTTPITSTLAHTEIDYPTYTQLPGAVDLVIQQALSPTTAIAGGDAQFVLDVTNNGPVSATQVTILDVLPAGVTLQAISPNSGCTHASQIVTCSLTSLATGEHRAITLSVRIDPTMLDGTTLRNTVAISQAFNELNVLNNSATSNGIIRRQSSLTLTQVRLTDPVLAGRALAYELEISNNGQSIATGVVLSDVLPLGVIFNATASSPGCNATSGGVTCALGTLLDAGSKHIHIAGTLSATLPAGAMLQNTATVRADGLDPNPLDNTATNTTQLLGQTYLPLLFNQPALANTGDPDLIVKAITLTDESVIVVIQNIGPGAVLPAAEFWVDLYIAPSAAPQAVNQTWQRLNAQGGLVWGVSGAALPLAPQQELTLRLNDVRFASAESHAPALIPAGAKIYAQVDSANAQTSYGAVLESHERAGAAYNNISGITLAQAVNTAKWLQRPTSAPQTALHIARPQGDKQAP